MFNRGITELLERLPEFDGLEGETVKRLLSRAYINSLDIATVASDDQSLRVSAELRRLATALEIHAITSPGAEEGPRRAAAFVAAESLNLLSRVESSQDENDGTFAAFGSRERYRRVESALLFVIAAFDANAVSAIRDVGGSAAVPDGELDDRLASEWTLEQVIALIRLSAAPTTEFPQSDDNADLVIRLRRSLWERLGGACRAHLRWLRLEDESEISPALEQLGELEQLLETSTGTRYADIAHLVRLLRYACDGTSQRALRSVPPPTDNPAPFMDYVRRRCRQRPVLWPSAERFRDRCLPGPHSHAAVAMPTGSGKSGVAELAVAQALSRGWVLYLAPTRALVSQIRRDLRTALGSDITVREFLGGAEFTALADEALDAEMRGAVLVMTPEKCSLALRQSPEAFATLGLCVFDECHLIGENGNRGVLAELVMAQMLSLAPGAVVVMQSALLANPEDIATWLTNATGSQCEPIRAPWRPTRTLRAVAGFDSEGLEVARADAATELEARPVRVNWPMSVPVNLMVSLQGPWAGDLPADYALVPTSLQAPVQAKRRDGVIGVNFAGYVNRATGALAQALVEAGHRVLAFIPANKHYSFSVGGEIPGFGDATQIDPASWDVIGYLLDVARFELGVESALRELLARGVAVHTSAMLQEERQASELAYDKGIAQVVFATGTLAQGLNMPATAVIIGGINIGYDPDLTEGQKRAKEQAQLLNAVGRAGRPYVAARSMALVIPNSPWLLGPDALGHDVRAGAAPFLEWEDGSFAVASQLAPLVARTLEGDLTVNSIGVEGLTAFAFLPQRSDLEESSRILERSYAIAGREAPEATHATAVAAALARLGDEVIAAEDGPPWLVEAAYASGLSLRQIVSMWSRLREAAVGEAPADIRSWATLLVRVLSAMPYEVIGEMLYLKALDGSHMRGLHPEAPPVEHDDAWPYVQAFNDGWLAGVPLAELAASVVAAGASDNAGRGSGNPLPKVIGLVEQIQVFGMTRAAGGLTALVQMSAANETGLAWDLGPASTRALEQLSMAIRAGCGTPESLSWWRFGGVRHRRLSHLAARLMPPPQEALATDELASGWMTGKREALLDPDFLSEQTDLTRAEHDAIFAFALLELS